MKKVTIETEKLKRMLKNVKDGASKMLFRPAFTGIYIEAKKTKLTMTTCDGYKIFTDNCDIKNGDNFKVISPIFKIPKEADAETIIEVDSEFITFNFGQEKHSYKIIEGEFIDWRQHFKKENTFKIYFNPKLLQEALKGEKERVCLEFSDSEAPMFINGRKLVLPLRVKQDEQ